MSLLNPKAKPARIKATPLLYRLQKADARTVIMQGGTGSSKTWSILQRLQGLCLWHKKKGERVRITIASPSLAHLKDGAYWDFKEQLRMAGLYREELHNKTDHIYHLFGSEIKFMGFDQPDRARGPRRDYAYINEANMLTHSHYRQLATRTRKQVFLDLNPSDNHSWVYELADSADPSVQVIVSNYMDNPYLSKGEIQEIERMMPTFRKPDGTLFKDYWAKYEKHEDRPKGWQLLSGDYNLWKVYGLGQRGSPQEIIYGEWSFIDWSKVPPPDECERIYGLDFGFNHPTALIEVRLRDMNLYARCLQYSTKQLNSELIRVMEEELQIPKEAPIYADSAEADRIEEIWEAGFNIQKSAKDVKLGIDHVKRYNLFIDSGSPQIAKEIKVYRWKVDKEGKVLDEPVKVMDDAMDGIRYPVYTHTKTEDSVSSLA